MLTSYLYVPFISCCNTFIWISMENKRRKSATSVSKSVKWRYLRGRNMMRELRETKYFLRDILYRRKRTICVCRFIENACN